MFFCQKEEDFLLLFHKMLEGLKHMQAKLTFEVLLQEGRVMSDGDAPIAVVSLVTLTQHAVYTCSMAPAVPHTLHTDVDVINGPLGWHVLCAEEALVPAEPSDAAKKKY